jgi:hypothetical protein
MKTRPKVPAAAIPGRREPRVFHARSIFHNTLQSFLIDSRNLRSKLEPVRSRGPLDKHFLGSVNVAGEVKGAFGGRSPWNHR